MRALGSIAYEVELKVGDMIHSPQMGIYTVLGEKPAQRYGYYSRVLTFCKSGEVFDYEISRDRNPDYPLLLDGTYVALGDSE